MNSDTCVAIAVLYPWEWLVIALLVVSTALSVWTLWGRTRMARNIATADDQVAELCERVGLTEEAVKFRRLAKTARRWAWPLRSRSRPAAPDAAVPPSRDAQEPSAPSGWQERVVEFDITPEGDSGPDSDEHLSCDRPSTDEPDTEPPVQDWVALGNAVLRRRIELDLTLSAVQGRDGPSRGTLRNIEAAARTSYAPRTLLALEVALSWSPGTAQRILDGRLRPATEPNRLGGQVPTGEAPG